MNEYRAGHGPETSSCVSVCFSVLGRMDAHGPLSSPLQDKGTDADCMSKGHIELGE